MNAAAPIIGTGIKYQPNHEGSTAPVSINNIPVSPTTKDEATIAAIGFSFFISAIKIIMPKDNVNNRKNKPPVTLLT